MSHWLELDVHIDSIIAPEFAVSYISEKQLKNVLDMLKDDRKLRYAVRKRIKNKINVPVGSEGPIETNIGYDKETDRYYISMGGCLRDRTKENIPEILKRLTDIVLKIKEYDTSVRGKVKISIQNGHPRTTYFYEWCDDKWIWGADIDRNSFTSLEQDINLLLAIKSNFKSGDIGEAERLTNIMLDELNKIIRRLDKTNMQERGHDTTQP